MTTLQEMLAKQREAARKRREQRAETSPAASKRTNAVPDRFSKQPSVKRDSAARRGAVVHVGFSIRSGVVKVQGRLDGVRSVRRFDRGTTRPAKTWSGYIEARSGLVHPLLADPEEYTHDLSIIFGTYNRLDHLKTCVTSIRQACPGTKYEIVISDGGSTDGTVEWLAAQPDVRLLRGDLGGAVKAFNDAFRAARGRIILTLNDDAELDGEAVVKGLRHFTNPMVGQVAFAFSLAGGPLEILDVHGGPYVNYGMIRASLAKAIAWICGGIWAPVYYTYGGDTELSCWVRRLGYTIVAEYESKVWDRHARDELRRRSNNIEQSKSGRVFHVRWPTPETLTFRGPAPSVTPDEQARLGRIEAGEAPAERWERLRRVDPAIGQLPPRATPVHERVLHIHLRTDEDPQDALAAALRSIGGHGHALVDWLKLGVAERDAAVRQAAQRLSPTLIFAQIQGPHLSPDLFRAIRSGPHDPSLVVVLWCGDVGVTNGPWSGFEDQWSHVMAKNVDAMIYTGTGQVKMQRERGMQNAAYLQIGFETSRYYPSNEARSGIVFLGQNYGPQWNVIPGHDAQVRRDLVETFSRRFKDFVPYGNGWRNARHLHQTGAGDLYRRSLMALSVSLTSELGRYTSDRMIRSMACGTPTLVKRFADMEGMGLVHGKNVLVWDTVEQAVEIAKHWMRPEHRGDLLALGSAGAKLMHEHHTWHVRMHELAAIVKALRGQR